MTDHRTPEKCLCTGHSSEMSTSGWSPHPNCPIHSRTSNEQTLVERLRDCVKVTFSAGLHGVESDCRQAADELDRQRAEIERLTRELRSLRDEHAKLWGWYNDLAQKRPGEAASAPDTEKRHE